MIFMNRKKGKALLALSLAVWLLTASFATVSAEVPKHVADTASALNLVPDDLLGREAESIRRADFLRMVVGLYDVLDGSSMPDYDEASSVLRAYELGLILEPETSPSGSIARQDAYVILVRLIDLALEQADVTLHAKTSFEDQWRIVGYAKPAVDYLYHHQIIGNRGNYRIIPEQEVIVEEAIALVYKVYKGQDRFAVHTDIPGEWQWHIEPVYDGLGPDTKFSNGLAPVSLDGQYGYIDRDGNVAVDFQYDRAYPFSEGRARVVKNGNTGYIDRQGNVIVPLMYEDGGDYSEEYVWIFDGEAYGFADQYGEIAIPLKYEYVYDFKEGAAPVKKNGQYGYINQNGAVVIPFQYDWASSFSEGLARTGSRGTYNYIDQTGQIALEVNYDYIFDYIDGKAIVFNRDQYAVIDRAGNFIIPFGRWGFIFGFHEGLSMVHSDAGYEGNYTYIRTNGDIAIGGVPFYDANDFSEGLAAVATHTKSTNKITRSYVTRDGSLVLPKRAAIGDESPFDSESFYLQSFSEGLAAVVNWEGKLGFIENPLLKEPVRGEAVLSGADQPLDGAAYTLTYSLNASKNVSAQDVVVTYNSDVLALDGQPVVLAPHTTIAASDASSPGTLRLKLATLGSDNPLRGDTAILELRFQSTSTVEAGEVLATVKAVLADGWGNEWSALPVWKQAVDRSALQALMLAAEQLLNTAVEGENPGQYAPGAKRELRAEIDSARDVLVGEAATQAQLASSEASLQAAVEEFEDKLNTSNGGKNPPGKNPPGKNPPGKNPPGNDPPGHVQAGDEHGIGTIAKSNGGY